MRSSHIRVLSVAVILMAMAAVPLATTASTGTLTVYSGRTEALVGPVFQQFTAKTGIRVRVNYGDTAQLAATILEEGRNSPADVFFAQDAGALGALASAKRLSMIPAEYLTNVDPRLKSPAGLWVGITGRARVVAYNTKHVAVSDLPAGIWGFTEPQWRGRIGWAVTNGSFQAFVTALRVMEGDARAEAWLRGIMANRPKNYANNRMILEALGRGEIHVGFTNHYYLFRHIAEEGLGFPVRHHYTRNDAGSIINIAGIGILETSKNKAQAHALVEFLLSHEIQEYFVNNNHEYPVVRGIRVGNPLLMPLSEINSPNLDLSNLEDLRGTLELLSKVGALGVQ